VKDHLNSGHRTATHLDFAEIAAQKLDVVRDACEICFVAGAEIVYHSDRVSERNEPLDEMRTDEAGPSGH
jgi:hypothetical protein